MMTRREKLLIRPWQLRRYNNHVKKVLNAVPIVDFGPFPQRLHIMIKSKKLQKEKERQMKIENDNFKLLQHLSSIMSKKRIDNCWKEEHSKFLGKVRIYNKSRSPTPHEEPARKVIPMIAESRKSKCWACTPHPQTLVVVPEERIPWEPPKKTFTRCQSKHALVTAVSDFDINRVTKDLKVSSKYGKPPSQSKKFLTNQEIKSEPIIINKNSSKTNISLTEFKESDAEKKIVIRQGSFKIVVNVRSFAEVKIVQGKNETYLQKDFCECKNTPLKLKGGLRAKKG